MNNKEKSRLQKLYLIKKVMNEIDVGEGYCLECRKKFDIYDNITKHSDHDVIANDPYTPNGNETIPVQLVIQHILD